MSVSKYTPEYLAEDRSRQLLNVGIAFLVLEVTFVGLFFTSRIRSKTANSWDTYLMIPSFIFCILHTGLCFWELKTTGTGKHVILASAKEIQVWFKTMVFVSFMYAPAVAFPKLSVLCLYLRVFEKQSFRMITYAIMAVITCSCIATWIVLFTLCKPFRYTWDKSIPGHCGDSVKAYAWVGFPNIITDVAMLILPFPFLWRLNTSRNQKIGLTITFLTFSVGLITSILRFQIFFTTDVFTDITFYGVDNMTWIVMESGMYLIAACLPSLRSLLGPAFGLITRSIRTRFQYYGSGKSSRNSSGKGSNSHSEGIGNNSRKQNGIEMPRLSDGNDQKDLVSCYHTESVPERNSAGASQDDLESGAGGIQVHKAYSLSTTPKEM